MIISLDAEKAFDKVQHPKNYQFNLSYKWTERKKPHMIISLDAIKAFDKTQYPSW